jgi:hypothetical protein
MFLIFLIIERKSRLSEHALYSLICELLQVLTDKILEEIVLQQLFNEWGAFILYEEVVVVFYFSNNLIEFSF